MSLFPHEMESERLRYERLHPDDFDPYELYRYARADHPHSDEITEYVPWDPHDQPNETFEWVQETGEQFESGETATYVLRPKDGEHEGEFAGLTGLHPDWDRQRAALGIWLRKEFWGQGYSGERAGRLLELAFDRLDLDVVLVSHAPDNEQSKRAIQKYVERYGGQKEGHLRNQIVMGDEPQDTVRYTITGEQWEENR